MGYNRNCIENDHYQVVQLNIVHDSRTYVRNVHVNDRLSVEILMALVWHHPPYYRIKAVAKRIQLRTMSSIIRQQKKKKNTKNGK